MALTKISTGMLKQDAASSDLNIDAGTLYLDVSNNRVGINKTSPNQTLHVNGISQFDNTMLFGSRGRISWGSMGGGTGFGIRAASGNALSLGSNGAWDKAIIDTSGNLLVATTLGYGDRLNINGTGHFTGNLTLSRQTNDLGSTGLIFEKTRNTSVNGNTVVQSGDQLGYVAFRGNDGDQFLDGAYILSYVDGTPGNNDMPTNLQFWTTADGASSPTERMRIDASGKVGIGTASPSSFVESSRFVVGSGTSGTNEMMFLYSGTNTFGAIGFADGTSGTARYKGIIGYHHTGDEMFFSTNGGGEADRDVTITSAGNVGIGTASPGAIRLNVTTPTANHVAAQIENSNTADSFGMVVKGGNDANDYTADFRKRDNTNIMRIRGDGNVGIGTTAPGEKLEVNGNMFINVSSGNPNLTIKTAGAGNNPLLRLQAASTYWDIESVFSNTNDELFFKYGTSTKMAIDKLGNVGIGTTSAYSGAKLSVAGSTVLANGNQFVIGTFGTSGLQLIGNAGGDNVVGTMGSSEPLLFRTGSTERMRIDSSGRVGINRTPSISNSKLEVGGADNVSLINVEASGNTGGIGIGSSGLQLFHGSSSKMTISSSGNVGIGTTAPNTKLHIKQTSQGNFTEALRIENSGGGANEGSYIQWEVANTSGYGPRIGGRREGTGGAGLHFYTGEISAAPTEAMRIDHDGNVGINETSPTTTLTVGGIVQIKESNNTAFYEGASVRVFGSGQQYGFRDSGGTTKANISMTGNSYFNGGNVGIGTTTPLSKLNVKGSQGQWRIDPDSVSSEVQALITNTVNSGFVDYRLRTNQFIIDASGSERMRIDSSGNVGIGTSSLSDLLTIQSPASGGGNGITIKRNDNGTDQRVGAISFGNTVDSDLAQIIVQTSTGNNGDGNLLFHTQINAGTSLEKMRLQSDGILHITSGATAIVPTIKHSGATGQLAKLRVINRNGQGANKGGLLELGGVTNDEVTRSDVFASVAGLKLNSNSNVRTGYLQFSVSDGSTLQERARITDDGNVGIGVTSPNQPLEVNGNIGFSKGTNAGRYLLVEGADATWAGNVNIQAGFGSTGAGGAIKLYGHAHGTYPGSVWIGRSASSSGNIMFGNGGTGPTSAAQIQMVITSAGNVGIGTTTPGGYKLNVNGEN